MQLQSGEAHGLHLQAVMHSSTPTALASDSRSQEPTENSSPSPSNNRTNSYSGITINGPAPNRKNAIIFDSIEGPTLDDYVDGLEELIHASEIRFLSKIANNRVCVYLNGPTTVEELENKKIKVTGHVLTVRPYISRNKRVLISNVSPTIPHEDILLALNTRGIFPVSTMTHLRAGTVKPGRTHILSFRRQVFIKEEDAARLPDSLQIVDEDIPSRIYLTIDGTNCFNCKQSGHTARLCPKNNIIHSTINPQITEPQSANLSQLSDFPDIPPPKIPTYNFKRPAPPSTTSNTSNQSESVNEPMDRTPMHCSIETKEPSRSKPKSSKKIKFQHGSVTEVGEIEKLEQIETSLLPVKPIIENPLNHCVLDYEKFKMFLTETKGNPNSNEIAQKYTSDITGLTNMITLTHQHIEDRALKSRMTKLKKNY